MPFVVVIPVIPRPWDFSSGVEVLIVLQLSFFFGQVSSPQTEEPQKKE